MWSVVDPTASLVVQWDTLLRCAPGRTRLFSLAQQQQEQKWWKRKRVIRIPKAGKDEKWGKVAASPSQQDVSQRHEEQPEATGATTPAGSRTRTTTATLAKTAATAITEAVSAATKTAATTVKATTKAATAKRHRNRSCKNTRNNEISNWTMLWRWTR